MYICASKLHYPRLGAEWSNNIPTQTSLHEEGRSIARVSPNMKQQAKQVKRLDTINMHMQ
jgi:hypothetical protein